MKLFRSVGLASLLAFGCVVQARAGAWNQPAGDGLLILRGTFDGGDQSFTSDGRHVVATAGYQKEEGETYLEYGITDQLQAIVEPDLVATQVTGPPAGRYTGLGTSAAGAQLQVLRLGRLAVAVQAMLQLPATTRHSNLALIGNTSRNADGRVLAGTSFDLGSGPSFVDAEVGYRLRSGGAPDEVHLDFTLGTSPWPRVTLLLQDFTTIPTGPGTAWFPRSQYSNLEGSIVYELTAKWSVQLGVFRTIQGNNALREDGGEVAVWRKF